MDRITTLFFILATVNYLNVARSTGLTDETIIYVASVQHNDYGHICNGAIMDKNYILTSAQCVNKYKDSPSELKVFYGSNRLNKSGSVVHVIQVNVHPIFELEIIKNDVALLKTADMHFQANISGKINLPTEENPIDRLFISIGWNETVNNANLQRHRTKPIPFRECMALNPSLSHIIRPWLICSRDPTNPATICRGESASVLVLDNILYGIATMNSETCAKSTFDFYTNIYRQIYWVRFIIEGYPWP